MNLRVLRRAPRYHNIRAFVIVHDLLALVIAWLAARWVAASALDVAWPSPLRLSAEVGTRLVQRL